MDFIIEEGKLVSYNGNASDVTIPEEVNRIGTGAFDGNATVQVLRIPATNPELDWDAFKGMRSLKIVIAYEGIGPYWKPFGCETVIILPEGMEDVPAGLLGEVADGTKSGLILVDGIKNLRYNALWEYSCPKLELPSSITIIEREAFVGGRYEEIVIPSSVFMINSGAFTQCTITKLTFKGVPIINENLWGDTNDGVQSVLEIEAPAELMEKYADVFKKTSYCEKIEREKKAIEEAEAQKERVEQWKRSGLCQYDGSGYNFLKKCKICGRKRDY